MSPHTQRLASLPACYASLIDHTGFFLYSFISPQQHCTNRSTGGHASEDRYGLASTEDKWRQDHCRLPKPSGQVYQQATQICLNSSQP
jgi:hypothetical protein